MSSYVNGDKNQNITVTCNIFECYHFDELINYFWNNRLHELESFVWGWPLRKELFTLQIQNSDTEIHMGSEIRYTPCKAMLADLTKLDFQVIPHDHPKTDNTLQSQTYYKYWHDKATCTINIFNRFSITFWKTIEDYFCLIQFI